MTGAVNVQADQFRGGEPEQVRGVGAGAADGVEQGELADIFDEQRAPGDVRIVERGNRSADRLKGAMHVDPRRVGAAPWDKIQRANVAGEIVGAEIDEDRGGRRAGFAARGDVWFLLRNRYTPETAG